MKARKDKASFPLTLDHHSLSALYRLQGERCPFLRERLIFPDPGELKEGETLSRWASGLEIGKRRLEPVLVSTDGESYEPGNLLIVSRQVASMYAFSGGDLLKFMATIERMSGSHILVPTRMDIAKERVTSHGGNGDE